MQVWRPGTAERRLRSKRPHHKRASGIDDAADDDLTLTLKETAMKYQITQEVCLADDDDDFDTCDEWPCDNLRDALKDLFATRTAQVDSGP